MGRLRSESGQVVPFVGLILLGTLLAVCALAIDMGVWFKASRSAQNVADAAALAGVQDLPTDPAKAVDDAASYALQNGGTLDGAPTVVGNTISVRAKQTAPAIFARILGIESETVRATASAQAAGTSFVSGTGDANGVGQPMPFAVAASTWATDGLGKPVTLTFDDAAGPGNFGLVDFGTGKTPGAIADVITEGRPGLMGPGTYDGVPGKKFNAAPMKSAIGSMAGKLITLPVFSGTNGAGGNNLTYTVVGWAAFKVTDASVGGGSMSISGSFVSLHVALSGPPTQYFGVGHVKLTK